MRAGLSSTRRQAGPIRHETSRGGPNATNGTRSGPARLDVGWGGSVGASCGLAAGRGSQSHGFQPSFSAGQEEVVRETLKSLRADHLLAASLAPTLDGLLATIKAADNGIEAKSEIAPKNLGDPAADLVYTPVTPCRLFDTRASQGGLGTPIAGVRRTYGAITPITQQGGPGGCAAAAGTTVALIQIGTLTPSGSGLLQAGPQGVASFPNALILYQAGDQYGTAVAMPLNPANGQFDIIEQFATADVYGDLLGYFKAPSQQVVQKQTFTYNVVAGGLSAPIPIPVQDAPVHVEAVNLSSGFRGITQVSILRCCVASPNSFLEWVGLSSTSGAAIVQGFNSAPGALITQIDFSHLVLLEVNDANSVRVHNTNSSTQFGTVTITW